MLSEQHVELLVFRITYDFRSWIRLIGWRRKGEGRKGSWCGCGDRGWLLSLNKRESARGITSISKATSRVVYYTKINHAIREFLKQSNWPQKLVIWWKNGGAGQSTCEAPKWGTSRHNCEVGAKAPWEDKMIYLFFGLSAFIAISSKTIQKTWYERYGRSNLGSLLAKTWPRPSELRRAFSAHT